ncbi:MAG: hypothetical protein QNK04_19730 [Myxococcota bacterium]|nr:hypothetical protein [Myxococcota bacterium]
MSDPDPRFARLVDFVEGRLGPLEFERYLYDDPDVEQILADDPQKDEFEVVTQVA